MNEARGRHTMTGFDVSLHGGLIVDGTGKPPFVGDVAIKGDTIANVTASVGQQLSAKEVINCTGLTIVPGFVDIHTHSDISFLLDPLANSKVMQGVTTEVVGNCGFSPYPVHPARRQRLVEFLQALGVPPIDITWADFTGYADVLAAAAPVMNVAPLVGHGALRIAACGLDNIPVNEEILNQLSRGLRQCLEQGAFGLSTGLTYVPSGFAAPNEIHALARVVQEYDALYATHARFTGDDYGTFDEAIEVGRRTGARVQYSHVALNDPRMWGRAGDVIKRFQRAVDAGTDIRYDVYPYEASSSSLTQYLPSWVQEGGEAAMRDVLGDRHRFRKARDQLAQGLFGAIPWDWERVVISLAPADDGDLEGRSVAVAAAAAGLGPEELCLELCARHGNSVRVVLFYRTLADVADFLAFPLAIVGSDGSSLPVTAPGKPHPRSFGTYARLLESYVVDRKVLSLADAVHKSTAAAAMRLGITDRGVIAVGARADVAVIDLDGVREEATWTRPCQLASGVRDVWINGQHVVANGALTGRRPGRVLRHGESRPIVAS